MDGKKFIRSLRMRNFLSFGSGGEEITLEPLNVLIGPNASGKSNLIEAIGLLQATPSDLTHPIREGGGIGEWLWKGGKPNPIAEIDATIDYPEGIIPLRYRIRFTSAGDRLELIDEVIENKSSTNPPEAEVDFFYRFQKGVPVFNVRKDIDKKAGVGSGRIPRQLRREDLSLGQSILSQRKDPDLHPELTYLGNRFAQIKLYREGNLGRYTAPRKPQKIDLPEDFLLEDASNLGLVLNNLQHQPGIEQTLFENLRKFHETADGISTKIQGGTVQVFIRERGLNQPVPATRLSDGTLRYLCLLTLLCHPTPPPLICIEKPELGLHPDILPTVAELLIEASQRTQLIITTHSEMLVSALTEIPESVIVCEYDDAGSHLQRLEPKQLLSWLKHYSLGELWMSGGIGGTRW